LSGNTAQFVSAGVTHPGQIRQNNEDTFLDAPAKRRWVVADGMGGHEAGEVASGLIVQQLERLPAVPQIAEHMEAVERTLYEVNAELRRQARERKVSLIGATVVSLMAGPDYMLCGWAGDSRAYRFHNGRLERLSEDHSSIQEMLNAQQFTLEQIRNSANAITRAVGGDNKLFLDWAVAGYDAGTQFLLCSDGLTKELPDTRIEAEFRKQLPPERTAGNLVEAALSAGGRDNVTVLIVRAETGPVKA
jgi:protein phosphatase